MRSSRLWKTLFGPQQFTTPFENAPKTHEPGSKATVIGGTGTECQRPNQTNQQSDNFGVVLSCSNRSAITTSSALSASKPLWCGITSFNDIPFATHKSDIISGVTNSSTAIFDGITPRNDNDTWRYEHDDVNDSHATLST